MSRLRGNLKSLLWLVLVAWIIQLPLAALHSHASDRTAHAVASAATNTLQPPASGDKSHDGDLCPICWSIATSSAALTAPPPPSVLPPPPLHSADHLPLATAAAPPAEAAAFDARGPPQRSEHALAHG